MTAAAVIRNDPPRVLVSADSVDGAVKTTCQEIIPLPTATVEDATTALASRGWAVGEWFPVRTSTGRVAKCAVTPATAPSTSDVATVPVPWDLLLRIDSVCSLVGYRYTSGLPHDVVTELRNVSSEARSLYETPRWDAR